MVLAFAVVAVLALVLFFPRGESPVPTGEIWVSSESVEQGSMVLVKISREYLMASGTFDKKSINFFRNKPNSDWIAYVGVDANAQPGKERIFVSASGESLEKEVEVIKKDFASTKMAISQNLQDRGYTEEAITNNYATSDTPALNEALKGFTPAPHFKEGFSFPLDEIEIIGFDFGRIIKFPSYQLQHFGVDLKADAGTKVYAANEGKVVLAKQLSNYGKTLVIDHGLGIFSLYLHLSQFNFSEGEFVKRGEVVGLSGNTGLSTGPHLHFSIKDNGARVDPIAFVGGTAEKKPDSFLAGLKDAVTNLFK